MNKREFLKLLPKVDAAIAREMRGYGKGVASEGYAGGYQDAIRDVGAVLRDIPPSDTWRFWKRAESGE